MGISDRQIRIFISSTFNDLNVERDYLINNIFKLLSQTATSRDVSLIPLDLRWGITAEESKERKVLKICLDEIRRTRPYFIGIIGERYGWCPNISEVFEGEEIEQEYSWVSEAIRNGLSITEMEMQYGVLNNPEPMEAFFYIKKIGESHGHNNDKLNKFRDRIANNNRYPVKYFSNYKELGKFVESDFMSMLDRIYPSPVSARDRELIDQSSKIRSLRENYIPLPNLYNCLDDFCTQSDKNLLTITSPSGMGKSALLANWLSDSKVVQNTIVATYFATNAQVTGENVIKYILDQLIVQLGLPNILEDSNPLQILNRLLYNLQKPILIVIDGIDKIIEDDNKRLTWLPDPTDMAKIIVSASQNSVALEVMQIRKSRILEIGKLTSNACNLLIKGYLSDYSKKLSNHQMSKISNWALSSNAQVLKTMLSQIVDFGRYELLDNEIERYLSTNSIEEFYQQVLISLENHYGRDLVKSVLSLLAISRNGLSEQELSMIVNFRMIDWAQFYSAIQRETFVAHGLINLNHAIIRQAILLRYMPDTSKQFMNRKKLVSFFTNSPFSFRKVDELTWQYVEMKEFDNLLILLKDLHVEEYFYEKNMYELGHYWNLLKENSNENLSLSVILESDVPEDFDNTRLALLYGNLAIFSHIVLSEHGTAIAFAKKGMEMDSFKLGDPHIQTSFLFLMTGLCQEMGRNTDAIEFCRQGYLICQNCFGDSKESNKFQLRLALLYYLNHKWKEAEANYLPAIEYLKKHSDGESDELGNALNELGQVYDGMFDTERALYYMQQALEMRLRIHNEKHTLVVNSYNTIGWVYEKNDKLDNALTFYQKGFNIRLEIYGRFHPDTLSCMSNLVRLMIATDKFEKAESMIYEQIKIGSVLLGPRHFNIGVYYHNLGNLKYKQNKFELAIENLNWALDIFTENRGNADKDVGTCLKNISWSYCGLKCYDKALEYISLFFETSKMCFDHLSIEIADAYYSRSYILSNMKHYDKAIADEYECLRILDEMNIHNISLRGDALYGCALDFREMKQYRKALEYAEKAAKCRKTLLGERHKGYINCLIEIMDAYYDLNEYQKCIEMARSIIQLLNAEHRNQDEDMGRCLYQLSRSYSMIGEHETSLQYAKQNLEVRNVSSPEDRLALARAHYQIAYNCICLKEYSEAEQHGKIAIHFNQEAGNDGLEQLSKANNLMGVLYYNQKRNEEAIPFYRQALSWRLHNLDSDDRDIISARENLAYALMGINSYDEAYDLLKEVLETQIVTENGDSEKINKTIRNIAECVDKQDLGIPKTSFAVMYLLKQQIFIKRTAQLCKKLAFYYYHAQQFQKSLEYWKHESFIRYNVLHEKSEDTAWALNNVGVILRDSKRIQEAIEYLCNSRDLWFEIQGEDSEMGGKISKEIKRLMLKI